MRAPGIREDETDFFSVFELKLVFAGMSDDERHAMLSSIEQARGEMLMRLIARRYPYVGNPAWLDGSSPDEA